MAELDPFDSRLTAAVQGFADRARTEVDAAAVAARAARARRPVAMTWLGRSVTIPVALLVLLVLVALLLSASLLVGGWPPYRSSLAFASPVATPSPFVSIADAKGRSHVTGTEIVTLQASYQTTVVGDVSQLRGGVVSVVTNANDPRASGSGTFAFSVDVTGGVGVEWGTYHLDTAGGAWDGQCSGSTWEAGDAAVGTCWLTGSGTLTGLTYFRGYSWVPGHVWVEGIIYPGPPPQP